MVGLLIKSISFVLSFLRRVSGLVFFFFRWLLRFQLSSVLFGSVLFVFGLG